MPSSFHEDNYDAEELEEMIDIGEACYCEVRDHYDWSDNIHGYPALTDPTELISCCDDCCLDELPRFLLGPLVRKEVDREEILRRIDLVAAQGNYMNDVARDLRAEVAQRFETTKTR